MHSQQAQTSTQRVGLMAGITWSDNLRQVVRSAWEVLNSQAVETIRVCSGRSADDEHRAWETLARSHCDGIIIHSAYLSNEQLSRLISTRQHVVLANLDDESAGRLAASTLIDHGHTRLAVVSGPLNSFCEQRRLQGFNAEIRELTQSEASVLCVETTLNEAGGAAALRQIIDDDVSTTAIFFLHDRIAIGALDACRQLGIGVPHQLSLLGCGDGAMQSSGHSALSTIHLPLHEVGQLAAERIMELITKNQAARDLQEPLPPNPPMLIKRDTLLDVNALNPREKLSNNRISARERECLQWASRGKTSWEISQILGITESTAIYHLRNATRKLEASNRLHAVAKALKAEIIEF